MKKIFTYIGLALSIALVGAFTACNPKEIEGDIDAGLGIKTFFPTKVVAGQPMTINGPGMADVREIVFPQGVTVTDFEHVGKDMLRVIAPAGISSEGGKLVVRTADDQAESRQNLTLGHTVVSGFSKQDGESISGGEQLTVFGTDLEFINRAELLDAEGNPLILEDGNFYRKGTSSLIISIPKHNIYEGTWVGKLFTFDGQEILLPELSYAPGTDGGHWEIVKKVIWENETGEGPADWGNVNYRFGLDGHDGNNECDATFPQEIWDKIKTETFYAVLEGENPQIRVTDGWWKVVLTDDIKPGNDLLVNNGDGTWTLEVNLTSAPALVEILDVQHLLFTGGGFTLLELYFEEETWVEGDDEPESTEEVIWENETGEGPADWGNLNYRFGLDGHDGNNECDATFPQEIWDRIKSETFYALIEGANPQIRITDGWWKVNLTDDIKPGNDLLIDNGDGTWTIIVNLTSAPALLDLLDVQHLLFTGGGYTLLKLFFQEGGPSGGGGGGGDEPGGDDDPIQTEGTVIWNTKTVFDDWSATILIGPDKFANAQAGDIVRVYIKDKTGEYNPVFKHEDWSDWADFKRVDGDGWFEAEIPESALDELKTKGLRFQGIGFTLAAVTLIGSGPETEGTVIWDTQTVFDSWNATILIGPEKFAKAKAGDIVRVYFKDKTGEYNPVFKHEDWNDWLEFKRVDGDGWFEGEIPESALDELKTKGLRFQGVGFTLVAATLIEGGSAPATEGTVIWDTETVFDSWSATILIGPEKFAGAKAGDIVRVYFKDRTGEYNPVFKHEDWNDWLEFKRVDGDGSFEGVIPEAALDELKTKGLRFQGIGFTLVAVTLIEGAPQMAGTVFWDTETVFGDWSATILISPEKFAEAKAGNVVRVYFKDKTGEYNPVFKHENWNDWTEFKKVDGDSWFEAEIPEAALDELKTKGLRFQGIGFTLVAVTLI